MAILQQKVTVKPVGTQRDLFVVVKLENTLAPPVGTTVTLIDLDGMMEDGIAITIKGTVA